MRRFELIEGSSSKFWEVELAGCDVTVRFGRIGTNGQTKTKTFGSGAAAKKEYDALLKDKTGKGYTESGVAAGPTLAAVSAPPPAAPKPAAPTPQAASPSPKTTSPSAPPASDPASSLIEWPGGGFQWSDELRKAMPMVRGIHAPPVADGKALLQQLIVFETDKYSAQGVLQLPVLVGTSAQRTRWDTATSRQMIQPANLERADHAFWLELCAQCLDANVKDPAQRNQHYYYGNYGLTWATRLGAALHGLPFMVGVALDMGRSATEPYVLSRVVNAQFEPLRAAIAACSDAEHEQVIAALERQAGSTPLDRMLRAELCPHRTDWALASFADGAPDANLVLRDCVVPVEALRGYLGKAAPYYGMVEGALVLQIHLHDDGAVDLIGEQVLRKKAAGTKGRASRSGWPWPAHALAAPAAAAGRGHRTQGSPRHARQAGPALAGRRAQVRHRARAVHRARAWKRAGPFAWPCANRRRWRP